MGTTGTFLHHGRRVGAMEAIAAECGDEFASRVIDTARKGTVVYAAVRDAREPRDVFGLVLLASTGTEPHSGERMLWTKAIHEESGPAEDDCPARILDLLTPTTDEYALAWRERCRARLAKPKARAGQRVRFATPLEFTTGETLDELTFAGGSRFTHGHRIYRVPNWRDRAHEVLA